MTTTEKEMTAKLLKKSTTDELVSSLGAIEKFLAKNDPWTSYLLAQKTLVKAELASR